MDNTKTNNQLHVPATRLAYYCNHCQAYNIIYTEYWTAESDGPFKVQWIKHSTNGAELIDETRLASNPVGEIFKLSYCTSCSRVLAPPFDMDYLETITSFLQFIALG